MDLARAARARLPESLIPSFRLALAILLGVAMRSGIAAPNFEIDYRLRLVVPTQRMEVTITTARNPEQLHWLDFDFDARYGPRTADGTLVEKGARWRWTPPPTGGSLRYSVAIGETREDGSYRSMCAPDWAVFRLERIVPIRRSGVADGGRGGGRLTIEPPSGWSVETPYRKLKGGAYDVRDARSNVDTPVGWVIAGKLGSRRETIEGADIVVSAPAAHGARRMDVVTFLNFTLPTLRSAFGDLPEKILLVLAPSPMWRGGLSAPRSLYLHIERPIVSENGTSTVLHELVHVVTRIRGDEPEDDWIAEGLAEFYAIELLHRAGGMTDARLQEVRAKLTEWSRAVTTLRGASASGAITARAVLLLMAVDMEIRDATGGRRSLDDVVQRLMHAAVATDTFVQVASEIAGRPLRSLLTPLLRKRG